MTNARLGEAQKRVPTYRCKHDAEHDSKPSEKQNQAGKIELDESDFQIATMARKKRTSDSAVAEVEIAAALRSTIEAIVF